MCAKPVARVALVVEDEWIVRHHILAACHNLIAAERC